MSHPESSKRFLPIFLGASILGGGLISIAVALQTHERAPQPAIEQATQSTSTAPSPAATPSPLHPLTPSPPHSPNPAPQLPVAQTNPASGDNFQTSNLPTTGTVQEMVAGDLMCYLTVQDDRGGTHRLGATFEVCQQNNLLNQRVQFSYQPASVADCDSSEPCGRSRRLLLVSEMAPVNRNSDRTNPRNAAQPLDRYTISNGEWTITVGNLNSWSGVNNTGNLSYDGCNSQNECLQLQGGRMTCRNGICAIGWQNGDYRYTLESPITEEADTARQTEATTLTVRQGDTVIVRASGFREVKN